MAIVKKYPSRVIAIHNSIEGVYTLEFESLEKPFKYSPGQFLHLAIDSDYDGSGQWPDSRCFSIQSNPDEGIIRITYSVKGTFTKRMAKLLNVGNTVWLKLPYGDLFLRNHDIDKSVFIAGGTGITPFLSLFNHNSFSKYLEPKIYLGFRNKNYNIYHRELTSINNSNSYIKIFYQDTDGIIDISKILDENDVNSSYFISGPPSMINLFKKEISNKGVDQTNIFTDDWE